MAKSREISFVINGVDNLSAVLKNAEKNLRGLTSATLTANNRRLQNAQAALKQVEAYKKLQAAIRDTKFAQAQTANDQGKLLRQRQAAVQQLDDMKKAFAQLKDAYKANWLSMGTQAAQTMKEQIRNANNELKAQAKVIQNLDRAYDSLPARTRQLQSQLDAQRTQLATLRQRLPTGNLAAAEQSLRAQIESTTQALNREIAALERRNQVFGNFSQRQQELSNAYSNFQNSLDTAQTIMNPFKDAADNAMTFEKSMSRLEALTQLPNLRAGNIATARKEMSEITATIERLGMTTEYTANQIAGAANFYAVSGWKKNQIEAILPATTDLATITQVPIDRVADMFSDDLAIMGVKVGQQTRLASGKMVDAVTHFNDSIAYAVSNANLDYNQLHTSLTYNAPSMLLAGLTHGDILAANMVSANAGLKGSISGTALRTGFIRLQAPAKKGAEALEEMGIGASEAQKEMAATGAAMEKLGIQSEDMIGKLVRIKQEYDKNVAAGDSAANASMINDIFGKHGFSTWANLLRGTTLDQMRTIAKAINSEEIVGWSADSAKIMRDNTRTSIDYLTSALDALQKAAGDALLPSIRGVAESVTPMIASLAEFTKQNPAVVKGLAAIATTASAAIVGLAGFSLAMAGVRFAQAGLATAGLLFGRVAAGATALRTALSGLGAGLVARISTLGAALSGFTLSGAVAGIKSLGAAILGAARAGLAFMFTPIGAALTAIAAAAYFAYQNWDKVSAAFSTLGNALSSSLGPAFSNLGTSIGNLMTALSPLAGVFETLGGVIVSVLVGALGTAGSLISGLAVLMTGLLQSLIEFGTGIADAFGKIKDGDLSGALDSLKDAATTSADSFKNAWLDAAAAVKGGLQGTDAAIQQLWTQPQITGGGVGAMQAQIAQVDTTAITQPIADASTQAATSLTNVQMPADMTGQSLSQLPPAIDGATSSSTQLAAALPAPIDGLSALGGAASSAAGALESAAARMNSVQFSAPQIVLHAAAPAGKGFAKGGFVSSTTNFFAGEHGAEAIVPLNHSQRSFDLWQETGDLLGFNQGGAPISLNLTFNIAGNADVNQMKNEVVPLIQRTFAEQLADYNRERRRRSFV